MITTTLLSPAIHVNPLGFAPDSPAKTAYLAFWGNVASTVTGGVEYNTYSLSFDLINVDTEVVVHSGTLTRRQTAVPSPAEDFWTAALRSGNSASKCEVWEMAFSDVNATIGTFRVSVPGIGASHSFRIDWEL